MFVGVRGWSGEREGRHVAVGDFLPSGKIRLASISHVLGTLAGKLGASR